MTREDAIKILMNDGWNYNGADAIADDITDDMTEADVLKVSEDYKDR